MRRALTPLSAFLSVVLTTAAASLWQAQRVDADAHRLAPASRRTVVLYRAVPARVRAAHAHPSHRALACEACHGRLDSSAVSTPPAFAACEGCHVDAHAARSDSRDTGEQAGACRRCHLEQRAPFARLTPRARAPAAIRFDHEKHRGTPCRSCHHASAADTEAAYSLPQMAECIDCHRTRHRSTECGACHLTRPDGRLETTFADGSLIPTGPLLGMAHDRDWLVRHRWVGADQGSTCAQCHSERDCERCHDAPRPPRRVHPGDFLSLHPQQSRRAPATCASCHTVQRFCAECHARLGLALGSAPNVGATGRVHPSAAVWVRGGGHALAARRDLSSCASCHAESDCVACHGAVGVGGGISPHGPGFRAQCLDRRQQNDRACRACHGPRIPACP